MGRPWPRREVAGADRWEAHAAGRRPRSPWRFPRPGGGAGARWDGQSAGGFPLRTCNRSASGAGVWWGWGAVPAGRTVEDGRRPRNPGAACDRRAVLPPFGEARSVRSAVRTAATSQPPVLGPPRWKPVPRGGPEPSGTAMPRTERSRAEVPAREHWRPASVRRHWSRSATEPGREQGSGWAAPARELASGWRSSPEGWDEAKASGRWVPAMPEPQGPSDSSSVA
jgi:hypothetical protein